MRNIEILFYSNNEKRSAESSLRSEFHRSSDFFLSANDDFCSTRRAALTFSSRFDENLLFIERQSLIDSSLRDNLRDEFSFDFFLSFWQIFQMKHFFFDSFNFLWLETKHISSSSSETSKTSWKDVTNARNVNTLFLLVQLKKKNLRSNRIENQFVKRSNGFLQWKIRDRDLSSSMQLF